MSIIAKVFYANTFILVTKLKLIMFNSWSFISIVINFVFLKTWGINGSRIFLITSISPLESNNFDAKEYLLFSKALTYSKNLRNRSFGKKYYSFPIHPPWPGVIPTRLLGGLRIPRPSPQG